MSDTVYIVDDEPEVRESLAWLLESSGLDCKVFASGGIFLEQFNPEFRGCLVLDVRMPGLNGLELLRRLQDFPDSLPVIVVTGHADVPMAVRAMKSGAFDFIEKPYNEQWLLERIQDAQAFDRDRHNIKLREQKSRQLFTEVTPREFEVLTLTIAGEPNKGIARSLGISVKTVELHRTHLLAKTGARSATELVRLAMIAGYRE